MLELQLYILGLLWSDVFLYMEQKVVFYANKFLSTPEQGKEIIKKPNFIMVNQALNGDKNSAQPRA